MTVTNRTLLTVRFFNLSFCAATTARSADSLGRFDRYKDGKVTKKHDILHVISLGTTRK